MKSTASIIIISLVAAVAVAMPAMADFLDNQISDEFGPPPSPPTLFRYARPNRARASYAVAQCRSCASNECQVMGMQRFSEPRCEAFGGLGSPCRMWQEPENKTLSFPDKILHCADVYMQFCPCARGLVCDQAECKRAPRRPQQAPAGSSSLSPAEELKKKTRQQQQKEQLEREERESFELDSDEGEGFELEGEPDIPIAFEPGQSRFPWAVARFH